MDPDLLRLLLLVLGVLLVAGIYLWDRYKRDLPMVRNRRVAPSSDQLKDRWEADREAAEGEWVADDAMSAPHDGADHFSTSAPDTTSASGAAGPVRRALGGGFDPEPRDIGDWSSDVRGAEPSLSLDLRFDAHGDSDYLHADPTLEDDVERKLIVVHLAARGGAMIGPGIEKACAAANLAPGDMGIYHRQDAGSGKVLFSLASMVEPGTFPFDDMTGFRTPGLAMFTQLPGVRDGIEIYTEMLTAARELARLLNAEIQDDRHNKLTQQMQDHMRDSIIEHRTRVRLARSRH
jgi:cell division protein ZipA